IQYGTPNYAAHGGFCSVNMAAAGLYTIGGAFWEFGEPDWEHTRYFMLFGVAEEHGSNPLKTALGQLKTRGAKFVSINPVRTGYSAIADEWVGIRPGTDGLFVAALIHELMKAGEIDLDYLVRYTNAPWLVIQNDGDADHGLIARDNKGNPLAWDKNKSKPVNAMSTGYVPALSGKVKLTGGRTAVPVFELLAERFLDESYAPEAVAEKTGVAADAIKRIAAELAHTAFKQEVTLDVEWTDWAGRKHDKLIGRPVSMHAMRGISAHSNGFHTCRMIHILQILLGSIDCPGGFRYKAPYPKQTPPWLKPAGKRSGDVRAEPLGGPHLGFPMGPADLLINDDGSAQRIDKAFSWDAPFASHGLMHTVINNAAKADPYPIEVLFLYMANMGWNSAMNPPDTIRQLTAKSPDTGEYVIPKIIYSDAYLSETVPYADLILPDTTYLERWDCISLLDRPISEPNGPADAIRQPVVKPDRDVRPFQDVLIDLGGRLGLPGFVNEDGTPKYPGGYPDYIVNHERKPGIGPLAGWRGRDGDQFCIGEANPDQLNKYIENGGFWHHETPLSQRYMRHANKDALAWYDDVGFRLERSPVIFQLYLEPIQKFRLAAEGHGDITVPAEHAERVRTYFDPLPFWYMPLEEAMVDRDEYPIHAITQRPMAMYHSWGTQNAWLRQIFNRNWLYMSRAKGRELGLADGDWVYVTSHHGRIKVQLKLMDGVNPDTVWTWNAIGKRSGAWNLASDAPEAKKGFLLNHVISDLLPERDGGYRYSNSDPVTGQAAWYDLRVKVEKAEVETAALSEPQFDTLKKPSGIKARPPVLRFTGDRKPS
ncbi:MAG: molybdopterin oxidoreductase family protein, partial [Aestuariivirgaceae bacterium]